MNYMVLDIEVDAEQISRKRFCDPLDKNHTIIMLQKKEQGSPAKLLYAKDIVKGINRNIVLNLSDIDIIVGHNIKFDLLYLWENESLQQWIQQGGKVWDTLLAEYLLEGQNKLYSYDLGSVCSRYGGTTKIDAVAEHFKNGKKFSELPKDLAMEYGAKDVLDTEYIYERQIVKAANQDMLPILEVHMKHLLAVTEMEFNGLNINPETYEKNQIEQEQKVKESLADLLHLVYISTDWPNNIISFDPNSAQQVSAALFGGDLKHTISIPNPSKSGELLYKTGKKKGQPRTKLAEEIINIKGLQLETTTPTKKPGVYQTGDKALNSIKGNQLIDAILNYRKEYKLLTTYYYGYKDCINPYTGRIHSEFKMAGTSTGRLASRNPNVQNLH
jgi:DNA polymerase I-like protein with 3'-5' exonuclease and polymerase domains